ncbi:MAG: signal peptide peptidase SppA [Bacteroidales bacterium]|nr:signal peptide peptidase SppA [Candidatus Cryptobacteroides aphodequi]
MSKFLKYVLATIVGLLIANLITIFFFAGIFSAGSSSSQPVVPTEGILKLDLSKVIISGQSKEVPELASLASGLQGSIPQVIGLRNATDALKAAAEDPGVKCLYIKPEGASMGMGTIYELRRAIEDFRASGKPVIAYAENPGTGSMYLGSAADKLYIGNYSGGTPSFIGISSRMIFLGDLLDRLGVNVQLIRHGKYKSAGEMYIRSSSSPENRLQNQVMISSIWNQFASGIAEGRNLTPEAINAAIDNLSLALPEDFVEAGLVDEVLNRAQLKEKLSILAGKEKFDDVQMIPFADYATLKAANGNPRAHKKIAIVYAAGNIVDGYDPESVDGDRFASILEDLRADSTIKAVVLRVNSPGGSVVASEKIRAELDAIQAVKPLVASYGDYAASGGYWISCGADKIYSDPTTLTGSIGVFGMIPDLSRLYRETAHVGVEAVNSNKHSDMLSLARPFTPEELAFMQKGIEEVYSKFVGLVAEGRDKSESYVDDIAQGRVWTGSDAIGIGLVDEIGTLCDALDWAAAAAGDADLSKWAIDEYPRQVTFMETLALAFSGEQVDDYSISVYTKWLDAWKEGKRDYAFAQMPFRVDIF